MRWPARSVAIWAGTKVLSEINRDLLDRRRLTTHCTGARDSVLLKLVREIVA
jgi:hypothetical protein